MRAGGAGGEQDGAHPLDAEGGRGLAKRLQERVRTRPHLFDPRARGANGLGARARGQVHAHAYAAEVDAEGQAVEQGGGRSLLRLRAFVEQDEA